MSIDTQHQGSRDIVSRVKAILMTPKTEWPIIAAELATIPDLYKNYILILAAIPAVMGFIQSSIIGITIPFAGTFRVGIVSGLTSAIFSYILSLVGIFVMALIIDALAPTFGATKNQIQALKTAAYAFTAVCVASVLQVVPMLGMLIGLIALLYSLYLLYLGLPYTMNAPADRAVAYTAVVAVCSIVIGLLLSVAVGSVIGTPGIGAGGLSSLGGPTSSGADVTFDPASPLGQLQQYASKLEGASKNLEAAQNSGDADAQAKAFGNMFGAVLGGAGGGESLAPDQLRALVPDRLGGLARSEISVERNAMLGIQISQAEATYTDAAGSLNLEIMDMGGSAGLMALAGWAGIEQDRQTDSGFERTYRNNNRIIHEVWDQRSMHGEFSIITSNRFMVKVEGDVPNMDALKGAAAAIDLAALDRLGAAQVSAR